MEPGAEEADGNQTPVGEGERGDEAAGWFAVDAAEAVEAVDYWGGE